MNKENGQTVAIKKLTRVDDVIEAKRALREIIILKNLKHENLLGLIDIIYVHKPAKILGDLYLVCELMDTDLSRVIKSQ
jgi:serine/threonine protein kinase